MTSPNATPTRSFGSPRRDARLEQIERERTRDAGRVGHEHHRVADPLHDVRARGRDHVAGGRFEPIEHHREMLRLELLPQARVAREIGEPDRELHDVQRRRSARRPRCTGGRSPGDDDGASNRARRRRAGARRRRWPDTCAPRRRTAAAPRAAPRCSSAATRPRPRRRDRRPHPSCASAAAPAPRRRTRRAAANRRNISTSCGAEAAFERTRIGEARAAPEVQRDVGIDLGLFDRLART